MFLKNIQTPLPGLMILTFSNFLSLLRGPLALIFLYDNPLYRGIAIALAMLTDSLDGYLARRFKSTSPLGAFLDPLMDKFFVLFIISVFIHEDRLEVWQSLTLLSRDFAVLLFGAYLLMRGSWTAFRFQSIWSGKVTTTLQFFVLLGLTFSVPISSLVYLSFIGLSSLALGELCWIERRLRRNPITTP